nr:hypothetical protein [Tanacetum cinerariifolium]
MLVSHTERVNGFSRCDCRIRRKFRNNIIVQRIISFLVIVIIVANGKLPEPKVLVGVCDFRSWDSVERGRSCRFSGERGSRELAGKGCTRGAGIAWVSGGRLVGVVGYGGVEQKMWEKEKLLVGAIITKLPSSWYNYKKKLMHTSKDFTLDQIQKHLRIEKETRIREKNLNGASSSKVNYVDSGKNNKGNDKKRKGTWNSSKDNKKDKKTIV